MTEHECKELLYFSHREKIELQNELVEGKSTLFGVCLSFVVFYLIAFLSISSVSSIIETTESNGFSMLSFYTLMATFTMGLIASCAMIEKYSHTKKMKKVQKKINLCQKELSLFKNQKFEQELALEINSN